MTSEAHTEQVRLRDGSTVRVRPIAPHDKSRLNTWFEALGEETRHRRFLGPKEHLTATELRYFTEVDHGDHEALLALAADQDVALGVARYVRLAEDPDSAEVAVAVEEDWHGRGLGDVLVRRLAERARRNGVRRFWALMLSDNRRARALFQHLGASRVAQAGGGTIALVVELEPVVTGPAGGAR